MTDQPEKDAVGPTAYGILDCLRMLAEEAAQLDLSATLSAIEEAMNTCRIEATTSPTARRPYH